MRVQPQLSQPRRPSVRRDGSIKWTGGFVFVGEAMAHEMIGLEQIDDGRWHVHLGLMRLGVLHERSRTVTPIGDDDDQPSVTHVPGHPSSTQRRRSTDAG